MKCKARNIDPAVPASEAVCCALIVNICRHGECCLSALAASLSSFCFVKNGNAENNHLTVMGMPQHLSSII